MRILCSRARHQPSKQAGGTYVPAQRSRKKVSRDPKRSSHCRADRDGKPKRDGKEALAPDASGAPLRKFDPNRLEDGNSELAIWGDIFHTAGQESWGRDAAAAADGLPPWPATFWTTTKKNGQHWGPTVAETACLTRSTWIEIWQMLHVSSHVDAPEPGPAIPMAAAAAAAAAAAPGREVRGEFLQSVKEIGALLGCLPREAGVDHVFLLRSSKKFYGSSRKQGEGWPAAVTCVSWWEHGGHAATRWTADGWWLLTPVCGLLSAVCCLLAPASRP
ncbi:hypothetical protein B2J93_7862 [Marssonina coronariae]|uniref:Uncharacterized protein n=1 Tax=Diplocarpon coronariae TaxID=2795749 RepID=A0A218ZBY5_9HELO|nr:hypothetical protein B2J93_7862 [Marssonina coronariae]